jgi:epoxyqueuosine reductase QueG
LHYEITKIIQSTIIDVENSGKLGKMWKDPIIEIISVKNEKLNILKEVVSSEHLTPYNILSDAKSIVCLFIPFDDSIVKSNINTILASEKWAIAYIRTNELIKTINDNIEILMKQKGYIAGKIPATQKIDEGKILSDWSHRHIAYIAGIGTFGINNMVTVHEFICQFGLGRV